LIPSGALSLPGGNLKDGSRKWIQVWGKNGYHLYRAAERLFLYSVAVVENLFFPACTQFELTGSNVDTGILLEGLWRMGS